MDKRQSEKVHAKRRAKERYDLDLTDEIRNQIRGKIKRNKGTFLYRQSLRVTVWEVIHDNKKYKVVYDKQRKELVTFLPEGEVSGL